MFENKTHLKSTRRSVEEMKERKRQEETKKPSNYKIIYKWYKIINSRQDRQDKIAVYGQK